MEQHRREIAKEKAESGKLKTEIKGRLSPNPSPPPEPGLPPAERGTEQGGTE